MQHKRPPDPPRPEDLPHDTKHARVSTQGPGSAHAGLSDPPCYTSVWELLWGAGASSSGVPRVQAPVAGFGAGLGGPTGYMLPSSSQAANSRSSSNSDPRGRYACVCESCACASLLPSMLTPPH
jgi:hypothetical protein